MSKAISLILFIIGCLFFISFYFLSTYKYKNYCNKKYKIKENFPALLNLEGNFFTNSFGNFSLILSSIVFSSFYILSVGEELRHGYFVSIIICGIIVSILLIFLCNLGLFNFKLHLINFSLFIAMTIALNMLNLFACFYVYNLYRNSIVFISFVLSILILAFMLILILNPKMTFKKDSENDSKFNYFAFCEWMMIISYICSSFSYLALILNI